MANKNREKAQRMASRGASVQEIKEATGLSSSAARTVSSNYNPAVTSTPKAPQPRPSYSSSSSSASSSSSSSRSSSSSSGGGGGGGGGKKKKKTSFKSAGPILSPSEAKSIAKAKGLTPEQVMSKALEKGIGLGSQVVKNYNTPGGMGNYVYQGTPSNLDPLRGLTIGKGNAYYGASQYNTPSSRTSQGGYTAGSTTYNPIVMPRGGAVRPQPTATVQQTTTPVTPVTPETPVANPNQDILDYIAGLENSLNEQSYYFQDALNQQQLNYDQQMADLSYMFNQQIADAQSMYDMQIQQQNLLAQREQEAARAFMINQGRMINPANLQIGATYGTPQLAGTQGFKASYRSPSVTPAQAATAFTAPTLATTAATTPMATQIPTVLNV